MTASQFQELLILVQERIQRADTVMRMALPAEGKLQVSLSFLAHESSFRELSRGFRVLAPSISIFFLPETLMAMSDVLSAYMKVRKQQRFLYSYLVLLAVKDKFT